jgi:uncharacterized protein (DUF1778 family)
MRSEQEIQATQSRTPENRSPNTKPVLLRITPDAHKLLKVTAAAHGQTMSNFVTHLVEQEATFRP